ncbi:hypothetical protein PRIPAC_96078 [Pristionchus pacificus]|uniref:Uncharacterized protein n=1 Tax=Pristionchus pacificus TaxID=54126 RepID=A0A454XY84_PRIPA|nr:hypothetical protein PRIPAC_96078 [Pristionchus pacificus]|eukprot:PDM84625.1 hypothetical protein PRIPAC_33648 [Pristionchus pacificus]
MTDKFQAIFEAFEKQTEAALTKGDATAAAALYNEHAVVVDCTESKHFYGRTEIRGMLEAFLKQGDPEPKKIGTNFFAVDENRFLADSTLETKHFMMTHKVLIQQLFQKKGVLWKCVYENISV